MPAGFLKGETTSWGGRSLGIHKGPGGEEHSHKFFRDRRVPSERSSTQWAEKEKNEKGEIERASLQALLHPDLPSGTGVHGGVMEKNDQKGEDPLTGKTGFVDGKSKRCNLCKIVHPSGSGSGGRKGLKEERELSESIHAGANDSKGT